MKLLTKLAIITAFSTLAFSEVTMCFKQNHTDMATIADTKLDGGLCEGERTPNDMKKEGWHIDDIKITNNSYFYIFKKDEASLKDVDMEALEARVLAKLEKKRKDEKEAEIKKAKLQMSVHGQRIYVQKCKSCHGDNAELLPGNSMALNSIKLQRFEEAMNGYQRGSYDLGTGYEMRAFSRGYNGTDVKNIYIYIQNVKAGKVPVAKEKKATK